MAAADRNINQPDLMRPLPARILRSKRETHDVVTLTLDVSERPAGLPFLPGQFTMLYTFGSGEVPVSISGDPAKPLSLVHTIRAVGGVTNAICRLRRHATLGVRGPFGSAWPAQESRGKDVCIVAGGIGIAPLRPFIYHLLRRRQDYNTVNIVYGARSPADIVYAAELKHWRGRFDIDVNVTVDHGDRDWHGQVGVVTRILDRITISPSTTIAAMCGPEVMMRFTIRALQRVGVSDESIYVSMERNMQCAVGLCGHCQFGPSFICRDGPVFRYDKVRRFFGVREY